MSARPRAETDYEAKLLAQIDRFGWSVTSVFDPDNELPSFSYSIGIFETLSKPEVLIIGQRSELGHRIINEYGNRLKRGETFVPLERYGGFIEGFDIVFVDVDAEVASQEYSRSARWLYQGTNFPLMQIVWPTTSGWFPWQQGWPENLHKQQPVLGELPRPELN